MSSLVLLSLAALAASSPLASESGLSARDSTSCSDVHIFLARGNNEPYPGRQGKLVSALCSQLASCSYEDLHYSALYTDYYCQTVYDGTIAGHVQMAAYANKCPDAKLILAGYSQGAQIALDILGGAGAKFFGNCTEPDIPALSRDSAPGSQLAAIIAFGDVRHTASQSFNYGNGSSYSGLFPRTGTQLNAVHAYDGIVRDWCVSTDPICASNGPESFVADHLSYFDLYSDDAAAWIMSAASLRSDAAATATSVPISVSGTAQVYSTIASDYVNPQTEVTTNASWMKETSVTAVASATKTDSGSASATETASSSASSSASAAASAGITASANSTVVTTAAASATATDSVSGSSRTLFSIGSVVAGVFAALLI